MAISYVGNVTGNSGVTPYWFGTAPTVSDSYTPTAGNTMLLAGLDFGGTSKTLSPTSAIGTLSQKATINTLSGYTQSGFSSIGVSGTGATITLDSSPTGDFVDGWAWEFSGVTAVSLAMATASSASTTVGAISASSITVPTGSLLYAVCIDETRSINAPPVLDNGAQVFTDFFSSIGVTYTGTGVPVTPAFTPAGTAATNYTIYYFLLGPVSLALAAGSYSITGRAATLLPILGLPASSGSFSIAGQNIALVPITTSLVMLANSGTYNYVGAPALSGYVLGPAIGTYVLTGVAAALTTVSPYILNAPSGSYSMTGFAVSMSAVIFVPGTIPMLNLIGVNFYEALLMLQEAGIYVPLGVLSFSPSSITVKWRVSKDTPGNVIAQSVAAGAMTSAGAPLTLTLSSFPFSSSIDMPPDVNQVP